MIFQPTCTVDDNACVENITDDNVDTSVCLEPCEGIFADVKRLPPKNITNENTKLFFENYESYKRFFEISEGKVHNNTFSVSTVIQYMMFSSSCCQQFKVREDLL